MSINISVHRNILVSVLKDIFTDHEISKYLGFKGGTAVLLFYQLERFSVDLDFDLIDADKEDLVFKKIEEILKKYGNVKSQKKRYSLFFLLVYKDKLDGAQNIKIEINKRYFGSKYEIKSFLGIPMLVMVQEDIFAHKLVAMHERIGKANRDIFDVWFFLKNNWPINKKIIEERTNISYKEFLKVCIQGLEKINNKNILAGLGELLNEKQKYWVKENLKNDTLFLLKLLESEAK